MGKQAEVVLRDGVPRIYHSLPYADKVVKAERVNGNYQAAIILECESIQRTRLQGLEDRFLINIDHHASARPFAHVNWIDPKAVATAEMIYRLAREAGVQISAEIATCLYTAVLTDTGSFMFAGTNEHTFALARELVLAGADPARCARNVYFGHSAAKMRLLGAALSNLHCDGKLAWISVSQQQMEQCQAKDEDCEGLVNYSLSIPDRVCGAGSFLGAYQPLRTISPEAAGMKGFTIYDCRLTNSLPPVLDPKSKIVNRQSYLLVLR